MTTRITVRGMSGGHCEATVTKALAAVPGVSRVVKVDRKAGEAVVEGEAKAAALVAAVVETGYEAEAAA